MQRAATYRAKSFSRRLVTRGSATCALLSLLAGGALAQSTQPAAPGAASTAPIGANLNITPKRLTFAKGTRSATVYIYNQGTAPASFDIQMVDRVMLPDGEIVAVSELKGKPEHAALLARLKSARTMVVATPRRAVLAPGKGQTIRLRVIAPASNDASEFRSHLTVTTMPPKDFGLSVEQAASAASSNRFDFTVASLFGLSIPIIIRSGSAEPLGQIVNVRFKQATQLEPSARPQLLEFDVSRSGPNSIYGNIEVRSKRLKDVVAAIRGVGVYPEIDNREFALPLRRKVASGEALEIILVDDDANPGRVLSRADFVVP